MGRGSLLKINSTQDIYKYIQTKFPKIFQIVIVTFDDLWKHYKIEIKQDWFYDSIYIPFDTNSRKLNYRLKQLLEYYEQTLKNVTEAKFKYEVLKVLVSPFVVGEVDNELKFERGNVNSSLRLKYKSKEYYINLYDLLESDVEDLSVYELGHNQNYDIGIPVYEFVNDTDNSIKKLKTMVSNITKICIDYYEKKEKIETRYTNILNKLEQNKEKEIVKLSNWKEN